MPLPHYVLPRALSLKLDGFVIVAAPVTQSHDQLAVQHILCCQPLQVETRALASQMQQLQQQVAGSLSAFAALQQEKQAAAQQQQQVPNLWLK